MGEAFLRIYTYMGVSKNNGTPKSSILIGFSIINHPFWGTPIFGNSHINDLLNHRKKITCPFNKLKHPFSQLAPSFPQKRPSFSSLAFHEGRDGKAPSHSYKGGYITPKNGLCDWLRSLVMEPRRN